MKSIAIAFLTLVAGLLPLEANAGKFRFGDDESIRFLANTTLPGPGQSHLFLGHLVQMHNFLLPYSIESKGYVLGISGESKKYVPLPAGEQLAELQEKGFLPKPLPSIEFDWLDYALGYSLWIALAAIIGYPVIKSRLSSKKRTDD